MFIDTIQAWAETYGVIGRIVAAPTAIICILISIGLFGETGRRFAAGPTAAGGWLPYVINGLGAAVPAIALLGVTYLAARIAIRDLPVEWSLAYLFVFLLGGAVGAAELVSRYKDRPNRALKTWPAFFYMSVNALGSCAALYLITVFRKKLGFGEDGAPWENAAIVQVVLLASFSALMFFRTSLFKLRVGEDDLAIGPSIVLDTLLGAADRSVDRVMAEPRAQFVHRLLAGVSFEKSAAILPPHCLALMQNVSNDEAQKIVGVVNSLRANTQMPDKIKSLNLGLALLTVVGEEVLETAVKGLEDDLQDSTVWLLQRVAKTMGPVSFERARRVLPAYCFGLWPKTVADDIQVKLSSEMTALGAIGEVSDQFKALILGIRLVRLTDGATLHKAVEDLGASIQVSGTPAPIAPEVLAQVAAGDVAAAARSDAAASAADTRSAETEAPKTGQAVAGQEGSALGSQNNGSGSQDLGHRPQAAAGAAETAAEDVLRADQKAIIVAALGGSGTKASDNPPEPVKTQQTSISGAATKEDGAPSAR